MAFVPAGGGVTPPFYLILSREPNLDGFYFITSGETSSGNGFTYATA